MNIAIIGSGGREHSMCDKLRKSKKIEDIYCIPGNAGTEKIAKNLNIDAQKFSVLYKYLKKYNIKIVIVGPEQPLVNGITDYLRKKKN